MAQAAPGRLTRGLPPWAAPVAVFLGVLVIGVSVVFLANRSGGSGAPPRPGEFVLPAPAGRVDTYDVRQADDGGSLSVAGPGGTATITLAGTAAVEALVPAEPGEIAPGDWLIVVGIPNQVRNFAITRLVAIPSAGPVHDDGYARSPGGFLGAEASRDPAERVVLGGPVVSVDAGQAVVEGEGGPITVTFERGVPPVYVLEASDAGAIRPGDRLIVPAGEPLDAAAAILLVPEAVAQ